MDRIVDALLSEAEVIEPPANLELLASFRGIRSIYTTSMREAGRLVPDGTGYLVQVNAAHSLGKRRFTVSHEICHTFFNEARNGMAGSTDAETGRYDERSPEEYLCDRGAGRILLH